MPNLRVISDNAIDRATLTSSSTETNFSVSSLQSQRKSDVWRSPMGTSVQLRAVWPTPETLQAVAHPFCNLSPTATMRVRISTETSVTNLLKAAENFESASWVPYYGIAAIPDAATAPDGSLSADALYPIVGTGATGGALYSGVGSVAAGVYTFSVFVKAGSQTTARLGIATSGAAFNAKVFNLLDSISSSGPTWKQEKLSNGWWRLSVAYSIATASTLYCNIGFGSNQAAATLPSGYLYVWGAQFETGSVATSYYPSQDFLNSRASTATYINNAGNLVVAGVNVPRFSYNPNNLSAPAQPLFEAAATNLVTASGTLTTGWTGAVSVAPTASTFRNFDTYQELTKTQATTSEMRSSPNLGAVSANGKFTASIALRAGTVNLVSLGLYDSTASGTAWGLNANAACVVLEGPGTITAQNGGMFSISNLSTTVDTVVAITRIYTVAATSASFLIYPGTSSSATIGQSILATRAQVEASFWPTSYIPTTTATVTRAADNWTSNTATRPTGYIDAWQPYAYDSGDVLACPAPAVTLRGFTAAQAASAYAFGGGACARHWMPAPQQAYGLAVDITDANNAAGYLESAQMVAGAYWEPSINFDYGASTQLVDSSKNERNDAGDLISDAGTVSRRVSLALSKLSPADRATLWSILRSSGARYPIFLSMFPEHSDLALERDHQVYGKLVQLPAMALPFFNTASATVEVESI